jgi:rieske iron-sulfur protein
MPDVALPLEEKEQAADTPGARQTRRELLMSALAGCACLATGRPARADDDQPGSDERPQKGDLLVATDGPQSGQVIKPSDLEQGGPPVHAWPKDPKTSVVRSGSRLNEVILIKLDPAELDDDTRPHAAEGILAYSAICSHAGCPVSEWVKGEGNGKTVLKCPCHNSEYDPRADAQVVFGPAPRRLAALPLAVSGDTLTVAAPFVGKVGVAQQG